MINLNNYKIGDYVQFVISKDEEYKGEEYKGEIVYMDNSVITLMNEELGEVEIKLNQIVF